MELTPDENLEIKFEVKAIMLLGNLKPCRILYLSQYGTVEDWRLEGLEVIPHHKSKGYSPALKKLNKLCHDEIRLVLDLPRKNLKPIIAKFGESWILWAKGKVIGSSNKIKNVEGMFENYIKENFS